VLLGLRPGISLKILTALPLTLTSPPAGGEMGVRGLRSHQFFRQSPAFASFLSSYQLCQALPVKSTLLSTLRRIKALSITVIILLIFLPFEH
jgi:hypothetical protein